MNERIRKLAEEGEIIHAHMSVGETFDALKKFEKCAELIVGECVRYFNEDYQRDFEVLWKEDLTKGMKKHFGVK